MLRSQMYRVLLVGIAMLGPPLPAYGQDSGVVAPPEIERTVDALAGHWTLTGTDKAPAATGPVRFQLDLACRRTALGAAVDCHFAGRIPGLGRLEATSVIGYSPEEHRVRWMEISSTGEYHDHRGEWKGDTLAFEPLAYSITGDTATEYLRLTFPSPGRLTLHAVTEMSAGNDTLECTGVRLAASGP